MKAFLSLAAVFLQSLPAFGLYLQPDLQDLPLERLLANLAETAKANPSDANVHHQLARTHAMAYARKLGDADPVKTVKGGSKAFRSGPWFGYEPPHVPFHKVTAASDAAKTKAAGAHLAAAIASYKKALASKSDGNPVVPKPDFTAIKLGLAWCQDQAGDRKAAIAGYREVAAAAWEREIKGGGRLGPLLYVETVGYLLPHLDARKDAAEIKDMETKKRKLLALPRAITPLVVPVHAGATDLEALVDPDARVRFDLDGSGRQLEWPWITKDAAWLVYDPRQTGVITSAIQMFGSRSFLLFCGDGYEALALLDDDRDGALRGPELAGLALWRDVDADGVSSSGEVRPLAHHGITSLSTRAEAHRSGMPYSPAGVSFKDGTTRPTYDLIVESR